MPSQKVAAFVGGIIGEIIFYSLAVSFAAFCATGAILVLRYCAGRVGLL